MAHFFRGKRPTNRKRIVSALLCCLLLGGTPALALDAPQKNAEGTLSTLEGLLENETPPTLPDGPQAPAVSVSPTPAPSLLDSPEPDASPSPSPSPTPEPEPAFYTVTFQMGKFGTRTAQVKEGETVKDVPSIPELPKATVLGWYDAKGQKAEPGRLAVTEDAVYTARWSRQVSAFLQTDTHKSYINGYTNGTFKPSKNVTRSEAAQLFYNLVREPVGGDASFPDVAATDWFSPAVQEMAATGILLGGSDGKFNGGRSITRAEFVKMAVSCDTLEEAACPFSDVPADMWYAPYIATAYKKGWVSGRPDGTFHPDDPIVRGEAVVILNKMLGRGIDPETESRTDVKNFYDVFPENWMYPYIVEASTSHEYTKAGESETWSGYEPDTSTVQSGWVADEDGRRRYVDGATRKFLRGEHTIEGINYVFDGSGAGYTGFYSQSVWRRYYVNGLMQNDISNLGVVTGPYFIKVYKPSNYLIVYGREYAGGPYNVPVKAILTSCGYGTPTGTFYTPMRYRWLQMIGGTWAQWCTQISGSYLFHSVPNWTYDNFNLEVGEYNHLGDTRSAGCIRMCCADAKWIFENCALGTQVEISSWETGGPLQKPQGIKIPSWHTWDPTDPTAYWKCQATGCH